MSVPRDIARVRKPELSVALPYGHARVTLGVAA
jgi:hypothetical protein